MENCVFCRIIRKEISSRVVYEDKYTMAILDIAEDVDGHILILSKDHYTNILDCPLEILNHMMETVQKVSRHLVDDCGYDGVNLLNANGKAAGQSVGHFHIHLIPQKENAPVDAWPNFSGANKSLDEMFEELKMKENGETDDNSL